MFFNAPVNPSCFKKAVYLFISAVLGILLSFLAHAGIEIAYLNWAQNAGQVVFWYGGCALPLPLQIALLVSGTAGGFLLGRFWWRKVYIERIWAKK